jgi:N utilization substance protein B
VNAGAPVELPIDPAARRAARHCAVQAIYQMELTGIDAETVAREFIEHRFARDSELAPGSIPDEELFGDIVRGVPRQQTEIDRAITPCLASDWKFGRIDSVLRAIMRAAAFELIASSDVPAKVVIDEYLDIAHSFFPGDEPAFVNAALDRLARGARPGELDAAAPNDKRRS